MPPDSFSPDILLSVGADLAQLHRQIAEISRSLNVQLNISGTQGVDQTIQRLATSTEQVQRNVAAAARSMNDLNTAGARGTETTAGTRREQERLARVMEHEYEVTLQQTRGLQDNERLVRQQGVTHARAIQENEGLIRQQGVTQARAIEENDRLVRQAGVTQARATQDNEALTRQAGVVQARAIQDNEGLTRQAGITHARAIQDNEGLIRQQGVTQARAIQDNERFTRQAGVTQARAIEENDRRQAALNTRLQQQTRLMEQFNARMAALPAPVGVATQLNDITAANARLAAGLPLTSTEWAKVHLQMDQVQRSARSQVTAIDRLGSSFLGALKWVAIFTLEYRALNAVIQGAAQFVELDKQLTQVSATIERQADRAAILKNAHALIAEGMTTMGLSAKDAGGLVFELGKTLDNNAELMRAAFIPALTLTSLKEVDQAETIRVLIGLYNLYGDRLEGAATPAEKFTRITDMLIKSSIMSVGSVKDLSAALAFVAGSGRTAGVDLNVLLSILTLLQDSLQRARSTGTGTARVFEQLKEDSRKIAEIWNIDLDFDKPVDAIGLFVEVLKKAQAEGPPTAAVFEKLGKTFTTMQGERVFEILMANIDKLIPRSKEIQDSTNRTAETFAELRKSVSVTAAAMGNELLLALNKFLAATSGGEPGRLEGLSNFFLGLQGVVRVAGLGFQSLGHELNAVWSFLVAMLHLGTGDFEAAFQRGQQAVEQLLAAGAAQRAMLDLAFGTTPLTTAAAPILDLRSMPRPPAGAVTDALGALGLDTGSVTAPAAAPGSAAAHRASLVADVLANVRRESDRENTSLTLDTRIQMAAADRVDAEAKLAEAKHAFITRGFKQEKEGLAEIERLARQAEQNRRKEMQLTRGASDQSAKAMTEAQDADEDRMRRGELAEREMSRAVRRLHANDLDRVKDEAQEELDIRLAKNAEIAAGEDDLGKLYRLNSIARQIADEKVDQARIDQMNKALAVLGTWHETVETLLRGQTFTTEQEYGKQLGIVNTYFAVQLANEELTAEERQAIVQRREAAVAALEADFNQRRTNDAIAMAQREGLRQANLTQLILTEQQTRDLADETAATEQIRRIALLVQARAGAAVKMLVFLQDEANRRQEQAVAEIAADEAVLQRKLRNVETLNDTGKLARLREAIQAEQALSEQQKLDRADELAANAQIARIEAVVRARARAAARMAEFLLDTANRARAEQAAEIQGDEAVLQRKLKDLETLNAKDQNRAVLKASVRMADAQSEGDFLTFVTANLELLAAKQDTVWQGASRLIGDFAASAQRALSDGLFEFFKTGVVDAEKLFQGLMDSMLRAISDFLAAQAVKALLNLAVTGVGVLAGFFGSKAQGGFIEGRDPRDTLFGFLSPGELVLNPEQANLFLSVIDKVTGSNLVAGAGGSALKDAISRGLAEILGAEAGANFTLGGMEGLLFGTPATGTELGIQPATAGLFGFGGTVGETGMTLAELGANVGAVLAAFTLFTGGRTAAQGLSTLVGSGGALVGFAVGGPWGAAIAAVAAIISMLIPELMANEGPLRRAQRHTVASQTINTVMNAIAEGEYATPVFGDGRVGDLMLEIAERNVAGEFADRRRWDWPANPASAAVAQFFRSQGFSPGGFNEGRVNSVGELLLATAPPTGAGAGLPLMGVAAWEDAIRILAARFTGQPLSSMPITQRVPEGLEGLTSLTMLAGDSPFVTPQVLELVEFLEQRFPGDLPATIADEIALERARLAARDLDESSRFGSADTGGLLRVHDGEVMIPRPFADEFPGFAAGMRAVGETASRGGGPVEIHLHVTATGAEMQDQRFWDNSIRMIRRAWDKEESHRR